MNFTQLGYFLEVGRLRNITQAAAVRGITQPALTNHIKKLEKSLGVRLIEKQGRGIILTDAGEEFYRRISAIFYDLDKAELALQKYAALQNRNAES
jgi:LysR family transcriptional activator of glutamate synthase operon